MTIKYTKEQLNKFDKDLLIELFLGMQGQMEELSRQTQALNDRMQLMMEQMVLFQKNRFGRSSEKMADSEQIRFLEVDGTIVFFNEAEAVCDLDAPEPDDLELKAPKKKKQPGKQLPDAISRCYQFIPASVVIEEHHIGVYSSKLDEHMIKAPHPREFLRDYTGICVTDGYQVYHTLEKEREDLKIAGCWVHCRHRFNDALEVIPKAHRKESILHLIMKQIQAIYREEGKLSDLSTEDRLMQRQLVVKPLVDAFFAYLKQNEPKIPKNGKIREAFTYALNQESYLKVFY